MGERRSTWRDRALRARTATIVLGAPIFIAVVWYGSSALRIVVVLLTFLATWEFRALADAAGHRPVRGVLVVGALGFVALAAADAWSFAAAWTVLVIVAAALMSLGPARRADVLRHAGASVLGALYVGALFAHLILLREGFGPAPALLVLGIIWANDIAAYLVGVAWGRHRLAPAISPGKSVEGLIAGLAAAAGVAIAVAVLAKWPAARLGLVGLGVAVAAVVGDLWESALKRGAGVKDSGRLLPGHGGVLDRFDAVLFGVPVGYYLWGWLL